MRSIPLAACAVAVGVACAAGAMTGSARVEQMRREIARLTEERDTLQKSETGLLGEIGRMDADLRLSAARIEETELELDQTRAALAARKNELAQVEAAKRRREPRLAARLRAIYENGSVGTLRRFLLPVGSGGSLDAMRYAAYLTERDAVQIAAWRETVGRLAAEREALSRAGAKLAALVDRETRSRQEIAIARVRRASLLDRVRTDETQHDRAIRELRSAADALEKLAETFGSGVEAPALDVRQFRGLLDWPSDGPVAEGFGSFVHPRFKTVVPHPGLDIDAPEGAPITSIFDGRVAYAAPLHGYGLTAIVDHGHGLVSIYAHASVLLVESGDAVTQGQEIGRVGDSGSLRGPYLYFELRDGGKPVDPVSWLRRR
jgi:septal ring factor EnvC (AmiA/AmiB activator)